MDPLHLVLEIGLATSHQKRAAAARPKPSATDIWVVKLILRMRIEASFNGALRVASISTVAALALIDPKWYQARSGHRDRGGGVAVDSESARGLIVAELDVLISGSGCTSRAKYEAVLSK